MAFYLPANFSGFLRQGDVCHGPDLPTFDEENPADTDTDGATPETPTVMVCSHSCDIQPAKVRTTGIIVCPVKKITQRDGESTREFHGRIKTMAKIDIPVEIEGQKTFKFLSLFPIEIDSELHIANFSNLTTMTPLADARTLLLNRKILEMIDDERSLLKNKLAVFFGRDEEL